MTNHRKEIRALVKDEILRQYPDAKRVLPSATIDPKSLPCFSVGTPAEDNERDGPNTENATTQLVVALSAVSVDEAVLQDELDDHSDVLEAAVLAALSDHPANAQLKRSEFKTGQDGAQPFGTVMMLFELTSHFDL